MLGIKLVAFFGNHCLGNIYTILCIGFLIRNLFDLHGTNLVLRCTGNTVECIIGQPVGIAVQEVEWHPAFARIGLIGNPCLGRNGSSARGYLNTLSVADTGFFCILGINLNIRVSGNLHQTGCLICHGHCIVMIKVTSCHHDQRIFFIRKLLRRLVLCQVVTALSTAEHTDMHDRCSGMIFGRTGPLNTISGDLLAVQSFMGNTGKARCQRSNLIHDLSCT